MCGIVGVVSRDRVNQEIYDALIVLQHRGQDAAGMVTSDGTKLHLRKGNGLVRDVFRFEHMQRLEGNIGIGHVRYPTAGSSSSAEAQPMYVNSPYGITLAHNGNLTNADQLKADLFAEDLRHIKHLNFTTTGPEGVEVFKNFKGPVVRQRVRQFQFGLRLTF